MSNSFQFLIDLALDPKKQERFTGNSRLIVETAGLSEPNKIDLNSSNRDALETSELMAVLGACCLTDPGPDPSPDPDPPPSDKA